MTRPHMFEKDLMGLAILTGIYYAVVLILLFALFGSTFMAPLMPAGESPGARKFSSVGQWMCLRCRSLSRSLASCWRQWPMSVGSYGWSLAALAIIPA